MVPADIHRVTVIMFPHTSQDMQIILKATLIKLPLKIIAEKTKNTKYYDSTHTFLQSYRLQLILITK